MKATAAPDSNSSAVAASALVSALNNAIRRSIMRFLLRNGPAGSPQIRRGIPISVGNNFNHHLGLLVNTGAVTREKRVGYREIFYSPSEAIRSSWVLTVLRLTEQED